MNRLFKNIKSFVSCAVVAAMLGSSVVSCSYDDTELWKEIENIKSDLADLRASVEKELAALRDLINGKTTIVSVDPQNDGSKIITLSDGSKITVYPKGDKVPADIVTIITVNGVQYWARYDGLGSAHPITDADGNYIPVADAVPQTRVNSSTNVIEISFDGGNTWLATGYSQSATDSIIVDAKVVYSEWQTDSEGNALPLYFELTLIDGSVVKIGMQGGKLVMAHDSVFVACGSETMFGLEVADAADYMSTTPKGWLCDVEHDAYNGRMMLNFTAPTEAAIKSGAAVEEGVAKLMVVFNNGSSAIASIKVSTKPAVVNFTFDGADIEVGYGVNYLLCGMVAKSEYNAESVAKDCNIVLSSSTKVDGVAQLSFAEELSTFVSYKQLIKGQPKAGVEYIFWSVVPATDADDNLSVKTESIASESRKYTAVSFKVVDESFFDVNVEFEVVGSEPYALGYALASEFNAKELVAYYTANPSYLSATHQDISYTGSFVELFANGYAKLESGVEYVAWYLAKSESGVYLEENLLSWEFSTMGFDTTGDIEIVAGEAVVDYDSIEVELDTEEPHMMIYYNILPSYMASGYPTDTDVIDMLIAEGEKVVTEGSVKAKKDKCKSGDKFTLFAVAVDKDGKIGKPFKAEYTTKTIEYNSLDLKLELVDYQATNTMIKVTCSGAKSYKYIYAQSGSSEWTEVYGGTATKAGEYIVKNPTSSRVHDTADSKYALVDGCIVLSDLIADKEYVVVVMAVDEAGLCSKAKSVYFTPIMNIGEFVYMTDASWSKGKPEIVDCYTTELGMFDITWLVKPQKGYTAYTIADHPLNIEAAACDTPEKLVAYICSLVDTGTITNPQGHTCEWREDGNYSRTWMDWADLDGDGIFESYVEKSQDGYAGVYNFYHGQKDVTVIFVTWKDEYDNFHEPFAYDPTNNKVVEWNYSAYSIK